MFLAGEEPYVRGMISGTPDDPDTTVTNMWAGDAGSC